MRYLCMRTGLAVVVCVVCSTGAWGAAVASQPARSPKVQAVAQAVKNAQSLAEVTDAVKNGRLSAEDLQQLGTELQKSGLIKKLDGMRAKAVAASECAKVGPKPDNTQTLKMKRAALTKSRQDAFARSAQQLRMLRPTATATTAARPPAPSLVLSESQLAAVAANQGPVGRIGDCPDLVVGEEVTVRGEGFGHDRGRVAILIRRDLYYCDARTWTDNRVVFTVTDELEERVGPRLDGIEGLLWLKRAGGETGPVREITILPNPDSTTPVITDVTPSEISPGQTFVVRGRNLVKYPREMPRIAFLLEGSVIIRAEAVDFNSEFIEARMPDVVEGLQRTACRLEITNDLELKAERTVTFVPMEEILAIKTPGRLVAACQPPFPGFLCLIGDTSRATVHDLVLKNGWVVEDCVIDARASGVNAGAHYIEKPDRGATRARAVIEAWADAYSRVVATETLFIRGPKGVPYQ